MAKRLESLGFEVVGNSPQEYATELDVEIRKSARIIESFKASGVLK